jgi:hypothetical protein
MNVRRGMCAFDHERQEIAMVTSSVLRSQSGAWWLRLLAVALLVVVLLLGFLATHVSASPFAPHHVSRPSLLASNCPGVPTPC